MKYDPTSEQRLKSVRFNHRVHCSPGGKSQTVEHMETEEFKGVEAFVQRASDRVVIRHEDERFPDVEVPASNVSCFVAAPYTERFPAATPELLERMYSAPESLPWVGPRPVVAGPVTPELAPVIERVAAMTRDELRAAPRWSSSARQSGDPCECGSILGPPGFNLCPRAGCEHSPPGVDVVVPVNGQPVRFERQRLPDADACRWVRLSPPADPSMEQVDAAVKAETARRLAAEPAAVGQIPTCCRGAPLDAPTFGHEIKCPARPTKAERKAQAKLAKASK